MKPSTSKRSILMLEDDKEDRYITESFFREQGYNIHLEFVTHGHEVIEYLDRCASEQLPYPDLILLDKNVPIGSGMDVLRQLKADDTYRMIPVVMISGTAFPKDVNESYRLGVSSYVLKPYSNEQTSRKISSFITYWFDTVELPETSSSAIPELSI